jgi:hypothetical protein
MLYSALQNVQAHWDGTSSYWQDAMRIQFVEQVWEPLQQTVKNALEAIDQLQVALNQMRRDCDGNDFNIFD